MSATEGTSIGLREGVQVADRRRWQSAMTSPIGDVGSERVNNATLIINVHVVLCMAVIIFINRNKIQADEITMFVKHYSSDGNTSETSSFSINSKGCH